MLTFFDEGDDNPEKVNIFEKILVDHKNFDKK